MEPIPEMHPATPQEQAQIKAILSPLHSMRNKQVLPYLAFCEPTEACPFRTIRSVKSGARLSIERNGQWVDPDYRDQWQLSPDDEATLAWWPEWTREELREQEEAFGF